MRATVRPASHRGQSGASLVLVLALVAFLGLVVPAVLGLVSLGPRITKPVLEDRRELYAASSALDAAVELGRTQPDVGVPGGPCPTQVMTIDSLDVTVLCKQHLPPGNGCLFLDRFVNYTAEVREPGALPSSPPIARAATEVVYRFDLYALPKVEVRQWTPNASGPVTTQPLPDCNATTTTSTTSTLVPTTSTTTTTTTPTTTTTTTIPPAGDVRTRWVATSTSTQGNGQNADWRGEATVEVVGANGALVVGATVTVKAEYSRNGVDWFPDAGVPPGTTTAAGTNTFHSSYRKNNNGSSGAAMVRLTVLSVTTPQGLAWNTAASEPLVTAPISAP